MILQTLEEITKKAAIQVLFHSGTAEIEVNISNETDDEWNYEVKIGYITKSSVGFPGEKKEFSIPESEKDNLGTYILIMNANLASMGIDSTPRDSSDLMHNDVIYHLSLNPKGIYQNYGKKQLIDILGITPEMANGAESITYKRKKQYSIMDLHLIARQVLHVEDPKGFVYDGLLKYWMDRTMSVSDTTQ